MDVTQQYALDAFRAAQQGVPAPPAAPSHRDWRNVRELWEAHQESASYGTATRPSGEVSGRAVLRRLSATLHRIGARKRPVAHPGESRDAGRSTLACDEGVAC